MLSYPFETRCGCGEPHIRTSGGSLFCASCDWRLEELAPGGKGPGTPYRRLVTELLDNTPPPPGLRGPSIRSVMRPKG